MVTHGTRLVESRLCGAETKFIAFAVSSLAFLVVGWCVVGGADNVQLVFAGTAAAIVCAAAVERRGGSRGTPTGGARAARYAARPVHA